jgi:hypothetical protein
VFTARYGLDFPVKIFALAVFSLQTVTQSKTYSFPSSLVTQVAAHPRNNLTLGSTFLTVERFDEGRWKVIATDANWETR